MEDREPVLVAEHVSKQYGSVKVLDDVSLTVRPGETVAVIGPSGSGKTTLARCINHLERIDAGRIFVSGQLIGYREVDGRLVEDRETDIARIRARVGMVFQRFNLFPHLTVLQNVMEGPLHVKKIPRREAFVRAMGLLERVGLADKRDSYPAYLSGGQQQRVAIARALAMDPDLMLFDEPTSALDPELVGEVLGVIRELAQAGMTLLIVSHEMAFVREAADRVVFMDRGKIVEEGLPAELFTKPQHERTRVFLKKFLR